jgi:hypothetical protein
VYGLDQKSYKHFVDKSESKRPFGDKAVNGRIILK